MRRIVTQVIDRCEDCPHHNSSGGLVGEADFCAHPKFKKWREIYGKERYRPFPSWCPLNVLVTVTKPRKNVQKRVQNGAP